MKSLHQHNAERRERLATVEDTGPRWNGIACPQCGKEMFDTNPHVTLTSNPPQKNVHCADCGFTGLRVA